MNVRVLFVLVLSCVSIGVGFALVGEDGRALAFPPIPPKCDNKCRERLNFHPCDGTQCFAYDRFDCLFCAGQNGFRCLPNSTDPYLLGTCTANGDYATIYYYDSCDDRCDCSGVSVVEAANLAGLQVGVTTTVFRYRCL